MDTRETAIATPIGIVRVVGTDAMIARISIEAVGRPGPGTDSPALREAIAQLEGYFAGRLTAFDLPLAPAATPRGAVLRQAIIDIAAGSTAGYGELARRIASSPRAIGQACARNPLPIIVPCHRVLGAGGALGAYSAGDGPVTKQWLLDHETRMILGT